MKGPHSIEVIRMRGDECWLRCLCGDRLDAANPESLAHYLAAHARLTEPGR